MALRCRGAASEVTIVGAARGNCGGCQPTTQQPLVARMAAQKFKVSNSSTMGLYGVGSPGWPAVPPAATWWLF
jgi:hypothetical protein